MAQSVIVKKEEKLKEVFERLGEKATLEAFKQTFKEMFPEDWERVNKRYHQHEMKDKKGKGHPMPHPEKYLENMYNIYTKKLKG